MGIFLFSFSGTYLISYYCENEKWVNQDLEMVDNCFKTIDEKKWKGVDDEEEIRREIEEEEMRKNIEDAECNYGPNSRDTVNGEWNVVFNEAFLNKQQFNDDKNSSSEE